MRSIYLLAISISILSCSSSSSDIVDLNNLNVPQGQAYVQSTSLKNEITEVLNYVGMSSYGKHKIKLHTNNSHYFFFAAVVDIPENEDGHYSSSDAELSSVKTFSGCFLYELCKDSTNTMYAEEEVLVDILVDRKMSNILNNDSLYISLNGRGYYAMPEEMSMGSWRVNSFDNQYFDLGTIVPILEGTVDKPEKNRKIHSYMMIGLISYDRAHNYDFDALFNSNAFASRVAFPGIISETGKEYKSLYISDYIINEMSEE